MTLSPVAAAVKFELTAAQDKARDVLISDATHICLGGGSRSGKTFLLVRSLLMRAIRAPGSRHVIFRFRFNALKASIIHDTLPKVLKLCFPELPPLNDMLNKTDWFMELPNGAQVWFGGLDDKERTEKILGMEFATIYFNECSQIPWPSRVTAMSRLAQKTNLKLKAYYDLNPDDQTSWIYRMFIEKKDPESRQPLANEFNYAYYQINPTDNAANLAPEYLAELDALPPRARARFRDGQFSGVQDGALWTVELLEATRVLGQVGTLPDFLRVVVAVDPSGCRGQEDTRSDEIGIAVVALGTDNHGYVLEDLSGRYSPEEWGRIAVGAFHRYSADRIVGEVNYGGDMVRAVIHAADASIPYAEVHASRGKVVRAEPIAFLYQQGKIHHVGYLPEIEDQLCYLTVSGYQGIKSPDRADAAIWGLTELFPQMTKKAEDQNWRQPQVHTRPRSASRYSRTGRR